MKRLMTTESEEQLEQPGEESDSDVSTDTRASLLTKTILKVVRLTKNLRSKL